MIKPLILFGVLAWSNIVFAGEPEKLLVVLTPVADIRSVPKDRLAGYGHDDLNETQVLYNEALAYKGENADWYQVQALEQKEFTHNKSWQGYPGWIRKEKVRFIKARPQYNIVVNSLNADILKAPAPSAAILISVSLGTRLEETGREGSYYKVLLADGSFGWIAENNVAQLEPRQNIIRAAKLFLGTPYLWGGRSGSAVDCSGLVNLAYRASGIDVPRDAHEQWMLAKPITKNELKPADLIFLAKENAPKTIVHVMLFLGKDDFIEAPGTGKTVRISHFKDYDASGKKMYFGRLLP